MRVLIDNGEYWVLNKGDLAMLRQTVTRLRSRIPGVEVGVLTREPRLLAAHEPRCVPVDAASGAWPEGDRSVSVARLLGPARVGALQEAVRGVRRRRQRTGTDEPTGAASPVQVVPVQNVPVQNVPVQNVPVQNVPVQNVPVHDVQVEELQDQPVPAAVERAHLVLALGGGYLADVDRPQAHRTLNLLESAHQRGIPTAMLGQGIGPLEDPVLRARAQAVLPNVGLILVRERRRGPALLDGLGVPADRVLLTGDDAVGFALAAAPGALGAGLGVCLRATGYAPVAQTGRAALHEALIALAGEVRATLVPVTVSEYQREDLRATLPLLAGARKVAGPPRRWAGPEDVVHRTGECRVVVTGAYHAALLALAQGVTVVSLSTSAYSDAKFDGLDDLFPCGVYRVRLDRPDHLAALPRTLAAAWAAAPDVRSALLAAAHEQAMWCEAGMDRVVALACTSRGDATCGRR